jgi:hypothetical protein
MSKRKNTLNDLEEFLKIQASTLAAPKPVDVPRESEPVMAQAVEEKRPVEVVERVVEKIIEKIVPAPAQAVDLKEELQKIAARDKAEFYNLLLNTFNTVPQAKDALLINTLLYLKHGDNWKTGIEQYWSKFK